MEKPQRLKDAADRIIDRHMPKATAEERAGVRENLLRLADVLSRIDDRRAKEWHARQHGDLTNPAVESAQGLAPLP